MLIANGNLFDPNFRQAVVLLVEHGEEGALGIVLNRPADITVADAVPEFAALRRRWTADPAAWPSATGGDYGFYRQFLTAIGVRDGLLLAQFDDEGVPAHPLFESVGLVTGEVESLGGAERARVYAGYAGWGAGQLERELEENSWIDATPSASDVFTDRPESLWTDVLSRKGGRYRLLSRMPLDPSLN